MKMTDKDALLNPIDAADDARCKDCKFYDKTVEYGCKYSVTFLDIGYFCSIGAVRKEVQDGTDL